MLLRQENDWSAIVTPKTVALNQCLDRSRHIVRYIVIFIRMIVKVVYELANTRVLRKSFQVGTYLFSTICKMKLHEARWTTFNAHLLTQLIGRAEFWFSMHKIFFVESFVATLKNWNHESKLCGERISFRGPSASCRDIGLTLFPEIYFPKEGGNHKRRGLNESQVNCTSKKMQIVSNKSHPWTYNR